MALLLTGVAVALVMLSGSLGRAHPTGSYRPDLPPDALTNGCWPLPAGVRLDFPYQVRTDGDVGHPARRRLVLQFDLVDPDTARSEVGQAFRSAGFAQVSSSDTGPLVFERPGLGRVSAEVTPLAGAEELVVRGTIVLDLPASAPLSVEPVCDQASSTKRFAAGPAAS